MLAWFRRSIARRIAATAAFLTMTVLGAAGAAAAHTSTLWLGVGLIAAIWFLCWFTVRRLFGSPLEDLRQSMHRAEEGDFLIRAKTDRPDEIGDLSRSFNAMLAKITDLRVSILDSERQVEAQKRELSLMDQLAAKERTLSEANHQMEQRIAELSLLFDITRTINSTLDLSEVLQSICNRVAETLGFEEFAILLLDEDTGRLTVRASYGIPSSEGIDGMTFSSGEGISGAVASTGKWLLIPDTSKDTRYLHYKGKHLVDGSFLCVPIQLKERLIGLFNVLRPRVDAFSEGDIRLLTSLANYAALALANAQLHGRIKALSVTDDLTRLANRRQLLDQAKLELERASRFAHPVSFLMIDIDDFKPFNDRHGHVRGDDALRKVASILFKEVRKIDLVARYGGEEFVVMLPQISKPEAMQVAEKLRQAVGRACHEERLTISVGVASYAEDASLLGTLIEAADRALYRAKSAGKNSVQGATMEMASPEASDSNDSHDSDDDEEPAPRPTAMAGTLLPA